ncbi:MAG: hypothetical protein DRH57_00145 [Candidatus Cloacimonadota bacterium]|nr:MAG: hypothetical protein DRH57_00145 [Candidatus Cloacimonadota bacterium]
MRPIKRRYYKVIIEEYCCRCPREVNKMVLSNVIAETFEDMEGVEWFLEERYGKIPRIKKHNLLYDDEEREVGFTYSFWNRDIRDFSTRWWQVDFIFIFKVIEERDPVHRFLHRQKKVNAKVA